MNDSRVQKLNQTLGQELGLNPYGEPLYRWMYSEDWLHTYLSATELDIQDHASGLFVCERKAKTRKMCPELHEQWIIAQWCAPGPEPRWREHFGDKLPYPARGFLAPTNVKLEPGVLPDLTVTEQIIGLWRAERKKTLADYLRESEEALAKEDRDKARQLDDMVQDACTAFGSIPGKRGDGVSFPSVVIKP